jgi:hypothetical protein
MSGTCRLEERVTAVRRVLLVACAVVVTIALGGCGPHSPHHYGATLHENTVHDKMDMLSVILHSRGHIRHHH